LVEAGIVDRGEALGQALDLAGIGVDGDHLVAILNEAGSRYATDVTRTENADAGGIERNGLGPLSMARRSSGQSLTRRHSRRARGLRLAWSGCALAAGTGPQMAG